MRWRVKQDSEISNERSLVMERIEGQIAQGGNSQEEQDSALP
jgi:hypothetical protein